MRMHLSVYLSVIGSADLSVSLSACLSANAFVCNPDKPFATGCLVVYLSTHVCLQLFVPLISHEHAARFCQT